MFKLFQISFFSFRFYSFWHVLSPLFPFQNTQEHMKKWSELKFLNKYLGYLHSFKQFNMILIINSQDINAHVEQQGDSDYFHWTRGSSCFTSKWIIDDSLYFLDGFELIQIMQTNEMHDRLIVFPS